MRRYAVEDTDAGYAACAQLCHCGVVNDRAVASAVQAGARTLAGVCRTTGAGQQCGTCVFSIKRLLCEHGAVLDRLMPEVEVAAS